MATVVQPITYRPKRGGADCQLHSGDHLSQKEFHRRYLAYPDKARIELVGGIVYMAPPLGLPHSDHDVPFTALFWLYESATPGVHAAHNATVILANQSEPQPDLLLRILPEHGGQSRTKGLYVAGAPELVLEVAHSSVALDLHAKKDDYQEAGVREYIVVCIEEREVRAFDLTAGTALKPDKKGVFKSGAFAGLWLDTAALFRGDKKRMIQTLEDGLATPEHAAFVKQLASKRSRTKRRTQDR